ncbi:PEP-CTERM/exosortase system-associated acyltransferase [Trichloromonas sp.]|uniref:PEP-CTERM/exosortase system-associated acyltransferase n=1 Tax=Trichloromonas sp. TaxID=3069249 RepID=UPI002A481194|nr:PEP-CTERM/exosortase system-associated acyltransferase [Trichloromonas sp.]
MIDFRFERVELNDPRMKELYALRYQVYCTECGFESPDDHPEGLETDEYDVHSRHFCAMVADTGRIVGTVRIVLAASRGLPRGKLPIEWHCKLDPQKEFAGKRHELAEISRLAISKDFRRREIDKALYAQTEVALIEEHQLNEQRRQFEGVIVAGLYQCIYHESVSLGLTHWYAVMVRGLCCLLRRWGVIWEKVGEQVEYHGQRIPYLANIEENARHAGLLNPRLLEKPVGWKNIDS